MTTSLLYGLVTTKISYNPLFLLLHITVATKSPDSIIHTSSNPLRAYEEDFIDGPIIDIGCGVSRFIIEYAKSGRDLFAIDNDKDQLNKLWDKLEEIPNVDFKKIHFIPRDFPKVGLPPNIYSVIILTNFLHFHSLENCKKMISYFKEKHTDSGSLIHILVHSDKHDSNNPDNPRRFDYSKHYFTQDDVRSLFKEDEFKLKLFKLCIF